MCVPEPVKVAIITICPSPYQVELFNALVETGKVDLRVIYDVTRTRDRLWKMQRIAHSHVFLCDGRQSSRMAQEHMQAADLVIFAYYGTSFVRRLIKLRARSGRAWCFWGERPGFRGWGRLGVWYRRWRLHALHQHKVPIWGIGRFGIAGYQAEFGNHRSYINCPYFSNLQRFQPGFNKRDKESRQRRFLFSGSLIQRKGVDLLAEAFARLASDYPEAQLILAGEGNQHDWLAKRLQPWRNQVTFLGFHPWEELPQVYSQGDILCVPSRYDGWGLVVPEGLAAGLPVIATARTGAALDLLHPGKNGWLIAAGQVEPLYQAMREALSLSPEQFQLRSECACQSVAGHSLQHGVNIFLQAITKTLNEFNHANCS